MLNNINTHTHIYVEVNSHVINIYIKIKLQPFIIKTLSRQNTSRFKREKKMQLYYSLLLLKVNIGFYYINNKNKLEILCVVFEVI